MRRLDSRDADTELGTLEAFRVFDKERTGFLSKSDLKNVLMNLGGTMHEDVNRRLREGSGGTARGGRGEWGRKRGLHELREGTFLEFVRLTMQFNLGFWG